MPISARRNNATKTIATRLEKDLPNINHPSQSGYLKGRHIGKSWLGKLQT